MAWGVILVVWAIVGERITFDGTTSERVWLVVGADGGVGVGVGAGAGGG